MPIIKDPNTPHMFFPSTAKDHGLIIAVVECAINHLSRGQCLETYKEIRVPCTIKEVEGECFYLTSEQIADAVEKLHDLGLCEVGQ